MSAFTLYTNPQSRGLHVMWMLEECHADYHVVPVAYGEKMKSSEYLTINPMGKVPALKHGSTVVTETAAIVLYLADQFPDKNLIPAPNDRAQLYRILFLALHCEYAILDKYLGITSTPERAKSIGYGTFETIIATLKQEMKDKCYLIGDSFSVLDLYVSGLLGWGMNHVEQLSKIDDVFAPYHAFHTQRLAYANTLSKTQKMLEAML